MTRPSENSQPHSPERDQANKALATLPPSTNYDVGYKKPPTNTRFKKGQSGNPKGRPRGARNKKPQLNEERLKSIVLEEAYRAIPVQDRGKTVSIPIAQAVVRSLAVNAAKGSTHAQRLFTEMLAGTEMSRKREHDALVEAAINFKVEWEQEFARCDRLGIARPDVLPHPDDVEIDFREGTVHFKGPMTKEERAELEKWREHKANFEKELSYLQDDLANAQTDEQRTIIQNEIDHSQKVHDLIKSVPCQRPWD